METIVMSSIEDMNDEWKNINSTLSSFNKQYPHENILYKSSGFLIRNKGDTPTKSYNIVINRSGNLIISDKRVYFSTPLISIDSLFLLLIPFSFLVIIILIGFISLLGSAILKSVFGVIMINILFSPISLSLIVGVLIILYQRFPTTIEKEHRKMKKKYLSKYQTLVRKCPKFLCYDGKTTNHFIGYREIDCSNEDMLLKIFSQENIWESGLNENNDERNWKWTKMTKSKWWEDVS